MGSLGETKCSKVQRYNGCSGTVIKKLNEPVILYFVSPEQIREKLWKKPLQNFL